MVLGFAVTLASAEVGIAAVFSDNMVLQQGKAVAVWGWADPGEKVRVTFGKCSGSAVADKQGNWKVSIGPLNVNSTGIELRVNTLIFKNVLVGEVWVCSGQSNMGWKVTGAKNPAEEIADAKNYPLVRLFTVANVTSPTPLNDTKGEWTVASPESVGRFSAVGYFFGRELHKNLKVPIGLINSSWGGTPAEAWTSCLGSRRSDCQGNEEAGAAQTQETIPSGIKPSATCITLQWHDRSHKPAHNRGSNLVSGREQCPQGKGI